MCLICLDNLVYGLHALLGVGQTVFQNVPSLTSPLHVLQVPPWNCGPA